MLSYLWDRYQAARLGARYERRVRERLLKLAEGHEPQWVGEEPGGADWGLVGVGAGVSEAERVDARGKARELAARNPHAKNVLRLLEVYVVGPGLAVHAVAVGEKASGPAGEEESHAERVREWCRLSGRLWLEFVRGNRGHWSFREHARRAWRDGECFVRKFRQATWPPAVRFLDPELIGEPHGVEGGKGIVTDLQDAERVVGYLQIDPASGKLVEEIAAAEMQHTRVGADSNEKRGVSIFLPVADMLKRFEGWMETELVARKLQASIVLWRKVKGSPGQVGATADAAATGTGFDRGQEVRRERFGPGTILTTSAGTELEFLQPNTNVAEAVALGRLLLLCIAAGEGLPEFMLTSDASNANYASTMVAEGPAVKMFQAEQQFFIGEFDELWRWVMGEAIRLGRLPAGFFEEVRPHWTAPDLVSRDRWKERMADVALVRQGVLSRQEVARREGVDPAVMGEERGEGKANEAVPHRRLG